MSNIWMAGVGTGSAAGAAAATSTSASGWVTPGVGTAAGSASATAISSTLVFGSQTVTLPSSSDWFAVAPPTGGYFGLTSLTAGNNKGAYSSDGIDWVATTKSQNGNWGLICDSYTGQFISKNTNGNAVQVGGAAGGWTGWTTSTSNTWSAMVRCGNNNVLIPTSGLCEVSTNGGTLWAATGNKGTFSLTSAAAYGNIIVCAGNATGTCIVATDGTGTTWNTYSLPNSSAWVIGEGDTTAPFCIVEYGGTGSAISSNGQIWTTGTLPSSGNWVGVTKLSNCWLAIQENSTACATSTDGLNWTARTLVASVAAGLGQGRISQIRGADTVAVIANRTGTAIRVNTNTLI